MDLAGELLGWAATNGRHFAFRETRDPYRVLVAETMAQQTQVARVVPALDAFLALFPTVHALAAAPVADVLMAWRGLGYNRRALNLHRAARAVVERHDGRFPASIDELQQLPGVGPYTARAIAVFAFGARVTPVDTNVRRVLSRVSGRPLASAELQGLGDGLMPPDSRAWTNALMDLGACVCRPARPLCGACPIAAFCASRDGVEARPRRPASAPAFPSSTRWLRGRILDRARDAREWATFDGALGAHASEHVVAMLGVMAAEGLLERHPELPTLARLPR